VNTCLHEQHKKELGIESSLARGRAQTCVEFPALIYTAEGKYCYSKAWLKIANEVDENCVLLGYYAASSGNFLPTFRDNLSVPSSGANRGQIGCPEKSVRNYP
jgi:hypothetical protein